MPSLFPPFYLAGAIGLKFSGPARKTRPRRKESYPFENRNELDKLPDFATTAKLRPSGTMAMRKAENFFSADGSESEFLRTSLSQFFEQGARQSSEFTKEIFPPG
jgi:hypothetical protein